jgi:glycogen synthase
MKNILILSPDQPQNSMGGLGTHLCNVLKNVEQNEFNVRVICFADEEKVINFGSIEVHHIASDTNFAPFKDAIQNVFLMQSKIVAKFMMLDFIPDVVHIMDWSTAFAGEVIAEKTNAKILFAVHLGINSQANIPSVQYLNYQKACDIEVNACKNADRIIHVSNAYAQTFPFNVFDFKTNIIHNGVNRLEYQSNAIDMGIGTNPIKLVYMGRLTDTKGLISLLEASLPPLCDLIIVGGEQGSQESLVKHIKSISRSLDQSELSQSELDKENNKRPIYYVGAKYGQEKADILACADLVIMPSREEPFGLVALESMAAAQNGKTILASSRVQGLNEFCNDANSLYCGNSADEITRCVDTFLSMTNEQKNIIRAGAIATAQSLSWMQCSANIQSVWNEL